MTPPAHTQPTPPRPDYAAAGRPLSLRASVRLMLVGTAVLLVFASGPLRDYLSFLPLWTDPVGLWLMDASTVWHQWMTAIGADRPHAWIGAAVQELRLAGAPG